jgi:hypothetical protein
VLYGVLNRGERESTNRPARESPRLEKEFVGDLVLRSLMALIVCRRKIRAKSSSMVKVCVPNFVLSLVGVPENKYTYALGQRTGSSHFMAAHQWHIVPAKSLPSRYRRELSNQIRACSELNSRDIILIDAVLIDQDF